MDFEYTEEQVLLKDMINNLSQNEIEPVAKSLEDRHEFPRELFAKLAKIGIMGMSIPEEFDGCKTNYISLMIAMEEISRVMPSLAVILSVHCSLFCYSILKYGNDSQKKRYLPKAARGEIVGAFSLSEPGAGFDATHIQTKAAKSGDCYLLNGTKSWVTSGKEADSIIIFATIDTPDQEKKLSAFIVDKDSPGLHISKIEEKMGMHASITAEIVLEECKVPSENLLGEEGMGSSIAFHCLDCSRIGIAAQSVGLSKKALEEAVLYALQREAFGGKISELQAIKFMIADMATAIEAARLLTYQAAMLFDRGKPFTQAASMAKLFASEAANKIAYQALQIHGGYGYSREFPVEHIYRDARVLTIFEGTSEIQRLIIARSLLTN